ncbi:MAG: hypothetical protein ACT4PS_01735 [Betaproteobacteria bacterium]
MKAKRFWRRRTHNMLVVAPASAKTWVVACSRRLIPGALFKTREAAIHYASMLARAAGLERNRIKVLGTALQP